MAYSRPISRSTIERCFLLLKLYKALFQSKTIFLVPFFQKKCPCYKFFKRFTQTTHPLNSQNLLCVTKVFYEFSLKCLLSFSKNYLLTKSCKSNFLCIGSELLLYIIFKGSNYRFSGVFKT